MDFKKSLKDVLVLFLICSVFGVALAGVYSFVGPIIEAREASKATGAYGEVIPNSNGFTELNVADYPEISPIIKGIQRENSGLGYAFSIETNAYGTGFKIVVGVSADGVVTGVKVINHSETDGIGTKVIDQYPDIVTGKDINTIDGVDAIGGATITSKAYKSAVKEALKAVVLMGGGEVDNRTEEEIFEDNLEAAVGDENADFTNVYVVDNTGNIFGYEELNVTSIYEATNGKGYVFVIGKEFVGVDAEGNIITETTDENKENITNILNILNNAGYVEVDTTEYQNSEDRDIMRAFKSIVVEYNEENGVYMVHSNVKGYNSTVDITMYVTIDSDGKVIDSLAVNHSESGNWGAAQFKDGVYNSNFVGKDTSGAESVDTFSGVTVSTTAYKNAVVKALKAINILISTEGGATNE